MTSSRAERLSVLLQAAFPRRLAGQVAAVSALLPAAEHESTTGFAVTCEVERLCIPYRVYFPEAAPALVSRMDETEAAIFASIYTRHHNGFVRQRMAERLLELHPPWAAPFILQLLGEYVVEIIQTMLAKVEVLRGEHFAHFVAENPAFVERTKRRIISYWDCYYRTEFPRFGDYPGYQLADALGWWSPRELPNIAPPKRR